MRLAFFARNLQRVFFGISIIILMACKSDISGEIQPDVEDPSDTLTIAQQAIVMKVETTGQDGSFQFKVSIKSPDTGCDQYANWWEVISPGGKLIYRRILAHSHVSEQPFTRSGGPVNVAVTDSIIVRGHMDPTGYGTQALAGSIQSGFAEITTEADFAKDLDQVEPLPNPCQF